MWCFQVEPQALGWQTWFVLTLNGTSCKHGVIRPLSLHIYSERERERGRDEETRIMLHTAAARFCLILVISRSPRTSHIILQSGGEGTLKVKACASDSANYWDKVTSVPDGSAAKFEHAFKFVLEGCPKIDFCPNRVHIGVPDTYIARNFETSPMRPVPGS